MLLLIYQTPERVTSNFIQVDYLRTRRLIAPDAKGALILSTERLLPLGAQSPLIYINLIVSRSSR